jgi:hypothetical protein
MKKHIIIVLLLCNLTGYSQKNIHSKEDLEYIEFLQKTLKTEPVSHLIKNIFSKKSNAYWKERKINYNLHPEKYKKTIALYHKNLDNLKSLKAKPKSKKNSPREIKVKNFEKYDKRNTILKNSVLFVGSSSIAGWETSVSFPKFSIINRGIGGMDLGEIISYYDILIKKHSPSIIAIYCDIDIEQGKSPKSALEHYIILTKKIKTDFPKVDILLLSMKPVLIDDFIGKDIRKNKKITNKLLLKLSTKDKRIHFIDLASPMFENNGLLKTNIFIEDGMHLNEAGYNIWNPIVRKKINSLIK